MQPKAIQGKLKQPAILWWIPFLFKPLEFFIDEKSIYSCGWKFKDAEIKTVSTKRNALWTSIFVFNAKTDEAIFVGRSNSEDAEALSIILESIRHRHSIIHLSEKIKSFLNQYKYIPRSECKQFIEECNRFEAFIPRNIDCIPIKSLQDACRTIALAQKNVDLAKGEFIQLIDKHNTAFVEKEKEAHKELFNNIEDNPLTDRQKEAAIKNEDYNLVVAGAGTGKTSCVVARIGYLLKQGLANPDEILVLAYGKDAQKELEERIKIRLKIDGLTIRTFHSLGLSICADAENKRPNLSPLAEDNRAMIRFIEDTVKKAIEDRSTREEFIEFIAYFREEILNPWDFSSLDEYQQKLAQADLRTLKGERVKSQQELRIANWLALKGVEYEYEKEFPFESEDQYRKHYKPDFYLTEYDIYFEHFGINESGETAPGIDSKKYRESMEWKRGHHRDHGTTLIESYSYQHRKRTWRQDLKKLLIDHGVEFKEISAEELLEQLKETGQQSRFSAFLQSYIALLKTTDVTIKEIENRISNQHDSIAIRSKAFLPVLKNIFTAYQNTLDKESEIDFGDMIQLASSHIRNSNYSQYKHIIVDEFQDISTARANLLRAIMDVSPGAHLFCVGDDWQSIFRFAGSDVQIMSDFENQFGFFSRTDLDITFRYPSKLLSAASRFVQQNPLQLRKSIRSRRADTQKPIEIGFYTGGQRDLQDDELSLRDQFTNILDEIKEQAEGKETSVLVLGRYNFLKDEIPSYLLKNNSNVKVKFQTVHRAKGAEADYVIVLSVTRGKYGFPTGIADDPLYQLVLGEADSHPNAEERRLFYVALTRAKQKCYLLTTESYRSIFIDELLGDEYSNEVDAPEQDFEPAHCPECGGKVVMKKGKFGIFWSCEFFPRCEGKLRACKECGQGAVQIKERRAECNYIKCEAIFMLCISSYCDGYLEPRNGKYGEFLGCSRYPDCERTRNI